MSTPTPHNALLTDTLRFAVAVLDQNGEQADYKDQTITVQQAYNVIHLVIGLVEANRSRDARAIQEAHDYLDESLTDLGLVDPKED